MSIFLTIALTAVASVLLICLSLSATSAMSLFIIAVAVRYTRTIVNAIAFWTYKALPLKTRKFANHDVTVLVPTRFDDLQSLEKTVVSILREAPKHVILSITEDNVSAAKYFLSNVKSKIPSLTTVSAVGNTELGKRRQMVTAWKQVNSPLAVFCDDDIVWSPGYLNFLIRPLEDDAVGAAGTKMATIRNEKPSVWNILGIAYLERRNFNTGAINRLEGATSTLSGRCCAYRSKIIQDPQFEGDFLEEKWRGKLIKAGDDKSLTRMLFVRGWRITLQFDERFVLYTTQEDNVKFLSQAVRWARSHWLGNFQSLLNHRYCYTVHPWTFYSFYLASFWQFSIASDSLLIWLLQRALKSVDATSSQSLYSMLLLIVWLLASKQLKMLQHFKRYPEDMRFIPVLWLFSYYHTFISLYALITFNSESWVGRLATTASSTASADGTAAGSAQESEDSSSSEGEQQ